MLCEQSAALGASLGVGPAQKVSSRDKPASSPFAPFLLGTASPWLYLAAIPPHLRRGKPRRKCSGRPGCGRPGRWRRHCQFGPQLRRSPNCQRLRGSARISGVASCIYSKVSACSRGPLYPARRSVRRSQGGPSRPRPVRPSATHSVGLFRGAPEPAAPTLPDRLPGHVSRPAASACKTSSTIGQPGTHARASVRHRTASPARRPGKGYKYILREAAADAAASAIMLA